MQHIFMHDKGFSTVGRAREFKFQREDEKYIFSKVCQILNQDQKHTKKKCFPKFLVFKLLDFLPQFYFLNKVTILEIF